MNLANVMDEVKTQLATISGLNCFAYPPESIHPPAAIVSYPESYDFDNTYARGMDQVDLPVFIVVGRTTDGLSTRDTLAKYCDGSGAESVKQVLEAGTYTAFDSMRVMSVEFDVIDIGGNNYWAAMFRVDIVGSGA